MTGTRTADLCTDTFPFAGISRSRFKGYALSPSEPDTPKVYAQIYALLANNPPLCPPKATGLALATRLPADRPT